MAEAKPRVQARLAAPAPAPTWAQRAEALTHILTHPSHSQLFLASRVPCPGSASSYPPFLCPGARLRLPPARGAPLPPALVLAVPVPLPAPAAARALGGHRAGARAVGRRRARGVRAPAPGAEGPAHDAAAGVRGRRGAHYRAQRRDRRRRHNGALLGTAQPHLRCWGNLNICHLYQSHFSVCHL
ncbi:hypothetical protein PVAP13_7KG202955 [Panicum virgatum]|uniref:Uncharacterized protein n=1 Tax=Panicum virgatum TaxID=38727 RepID=A0A8T0QH42_PANVG|nr:hypothetical protein PVAP13_7KG202955 [Panicum virgatum]